MAKRPRRSTGFEAWLNAAQTPMYLLDKRRQVTIFNRGCETLTGWTANEIVGGLCDYASPPDDAPLDRFLASLCPPPSVYEGESLQAPAFLPTKGGGAESRMLHHFSMANRDGVIDRVLTFMLPIRNPPVVNTVSAAQKLHAELASLRLSLRERYGFSTVVTASDSMHRVIRQIRLAAESTASVHLVGEPGTGREHLARVSHNEGELKSTSFVPLDCQRLSAVELLNTVRRLFDNQPGETGNLPHLQTGTLFFQSIEKLHRDIQQVLVESWDGMNPQMPRRLVTSSSLSIDQLATHENLLPSFVGLCGTIEVRVPALRHRFEDLPLLAQLVVEQRNEGRLDQIEGLHESTLTKLREYHWPGNITELRELILEAVDQCDGLTVLPEHLPSRFRLGMGARRTSPPMKTQEMPLEPLLVSIEKEHIQKVLQLCKGNRTEAAKLLNITRPKLYRRMEQLGLSDVAD